MGSLFSREHTLVDTAWVHQADSFVFEAPNEAMMGILSYLPPEDRRACRRACKKLAHDVRSFVGPLDTCVIKPTTTEGAIRFYAKCALRRLRLDGQGVMDLTQIEDFLHRPQALRHFAFLPHGILDLKLAIEILKTCQNLQSLAWSGLMRGFRWDSGLLCGRLGQPLRLPKLRSLYIDMVQPNRASEVGGLLIRNSTLLLRRLECPQLAEATLVLQNVRGYNKLAARTLSQLVLMESLKKFLGRNKGVNKVRVFHDELSSPTYLDEGDEGPPEACGFDLDFSETPCGQFLDDLFEEEERDPSFQPVPAPDPPL